MRSELDEAYRKLGNLRRRIAAIKHREAPVNIFGELASVSLESATAFGLSAFAKVGDLISTGTVSRAFGSVVRIEPELVTLKTFGPAPVTIGDQIRLLGGPRIEPHEAWKGRIVDPLGQPLDDGGDLPNGLEEVSLDGTSGMTPSFSETWSNCRTGVRVLDIFAPIALGQRIGVFAGSGVGKSTLLGMIANRTKFDAIIVAFVGERKREVAEFRQRCLGAAGDRAISVVATGDHSAVLRRFAPLSAMTLAEWFRAQGQDVLLIIDSLTRFAHACREVSLASGEPPVARGYPAGISSEIARLLERAGPDVRSGGSITAVVSVLVDGDDHNEPVSDIARGILDGHVVLDRALAERFHFPPVDVLKSISRLGDRVLTRSELELAAKARRLIALYEETRDLRAIGAYAPGSNSAIDRASVVAPRIFDFLCESPGDAVDRAPFEALSRILAT